MISFEKRLKRQMLLNRVNRISQESNLEDIYRSMMIRGLHNKIGINTINNQGGTL